MTFKEQTGYDNIFDLASAMHKQAADLFADGDTTRVEIHCIDGNTSIMVDGVDIDWRERLEKNLFAYMQETINDAGKGVKRNEQNNRND